MRKARGADDWDRPSSLRSRASYKDSKSQPNSPQAVADPPVYSHEEVLLAALVWTV